MANFTIDGPVEIDAAFALKLFETMPEVGRAGVAQVFAARLMSGPLTDKAVEAAARVYAERIKISESSAKALRDAVAERVRGLGEKQLNVQQVQAVIDDEARKSAAEYARKNIESIMSALPLESYVAAVMPAVIEEVKARANYYFTRNQQGQQWLLDLIQRVCEDDGPLREAVTEKMTELAEPKVNGRLTREKRA